MQKEGNKSTRRGPARAHRAGPAAVATPVVTTDLAGAVALTRVAAGAGAVAGVLRQGRERAVGV